MANGTTTVEQDEEFTPPPPERVGEEHGSMTRIVQELVYTVDHKKLGLMYIGAGFLFFVVAGIMATLMRMQLFFPGSKFLEPDVFNRFFTMHGTTMIFLVAMPIMFGFANYLVPLMIGTRDMAFPRLNAFGFWVFLFGGLLLFVSYFTAPGLYDAGSAPDVGWFAYAPLTAKAFSRGHSTDYWTLSLLLSGIGSIATAINVLVTVFCLRCKGMTLGKMPLFVWMMLVTSFLVVIAMPPLSACQIMLLLDRYLGAKFFDTQAGGSAVLWQHFFWIFGHPEVYILVLPAFAIASEVIPVFSRKPIFGYPVMVAATVSIALHQPGRVGAPHVHRRHDLDRQHLLRHLDDDYRGADRHQDLQLARHDVRAGRSASTRRCSSASAFSFNFSLRGLTGVMLAVAPFDWQLSDSYFVVAHFHYVILGGIVFSLSSPASTIGIRKPSAECSTRSSASGTSGCSSSGFT